MNNNFSIPPQITYILQTLESAGHRAFTVGGCVRDYLLGRHPDDFDICTSARPEETMSLFPHTVPTGIAHGTVTVLYDGIATEVTVFRKEGNYSDHRRPDSVEFTDDLTEDLARRDFTVNAMAMDLRGALHDPFGGRADLSARLIRCVGDPHQRLREDALRMHRALRFSAQLGFSIHEDTLSAIRKNAPYAAYVAPERIRIELEKTLLSARPQILEQGIAWGLYAPMIPAGQCPDLYSLTELPQERAVRYTRLFHLLCDAGIVSDAEGALRDLRMDKATIRAVSRGIAAARRGLPETDIGMKHLMAAEDELCLRCAAACGDFDRLTKRYYDILLTNEPWHIRHLAVSGTQLQTLGISGKAVGGILQRLLDEVIRDPSLNRPDVLTELAKKEAAQWQNN